MKYLKLILILSSISSAQAMQEQWEVAELENSRRTVKTPTIETLKEDKYDILAHEVASYFPQKVRKSVLTEMVRSDYLTPPSKDKKPSKKKKALSELMEGIKKKYRDYTHEEILQHCSYSLAEKYFLELPPQYPLQPNHKKKLLKVFFKSWETSKGTKVFYKKEIKEIRKSILLAAKREKKQEMDSEELASLYTFIITALKYEIADKDSKSGKLDIRLEKIPLQKYKDEFIAATKSSGDLIRNYFTILQSTVVKNTYVSG